MHNFWELKKYERHTKHNEPIFDLSCQSNIYFYFYDALGFVKFKCQKKCIKLIKHISYIFPLGKKEK